MGETPHVSPVELLQQQYIAFLFLVLLPEPEPHGYILVTKVLGHRGGVRGEVAATPTTGGVNYRPCNINNTSTVVSRVKIDSSYVP